jgi:hypothetical protein
MTHLPPGLDHAAGSAARRLLGWASGRRTSSQGTWIRALSAEVDEMDTGLDQLAWAVGVLPLILVERGSALGRTWRPRLLWLASAGGVGGLRVYGPAVVAGILMLAWTYEHRGTETGAPVLFAASMFIPFCVLRGLLAARRRSADAAAAIGAATAVVSFVVFVLGAVVYVGIMVSGTVWVALPLMGLVFGLVVAAVGAACGLLGAALAHPTTTIRSIRSRRR